MSKRKILEELTIRDNFMSAAVMAKQENCRRLLEMVLDITIDHLEVITEKSILYHPEYHGIRLGTGNTVTPSTNGSVRPIGSLKMTVIR